MRSAWKSNGSGIFCFCHSITKTGVGDVYTRDQLISECKTSASLRGKKIGANGVAEAGSGDYTSGAVGSMRGILFERTERRKHNS